jgi:hypothetical protein
MSAAGNLTFIGSYSIETDGGWITPGRHAGIITFTTPNNPYYNNPYFVNNGFRWGNIRFITLGAGPACYDEVIF